MWRRLLMVAVLAVPMLPAAVSAAGVGATRIGDAERGAALFAGDCAKCHEIGADARDRVGPQLNRIFGRRAAAMGAFNYSRSIRRMGADGLMWTLDTLDAYIENPKALVSGTRMNYAGMAARVDRDDLLAFLRAWSDQPQNIPEAAPTARKLEVELPPEILALQGDPEYGEYLAAECTTCHQRDGSDQGIPSITGWPAADFVVAMHAYKRKLRPHPVMQMMAARLDDDEIAALAAYFHQAE